MEFIGIVFLLFGVFFCSVGVLGVIRMPDVYSRLHASGKVATLGLFGLLVGAAFLMPSTTLKVIALGLFILMASPVASHAIAASEYRRREIVDELVEMAITNHPESKLDSINTTTSGYLAQSDIHDIIQAQVNISHRRDADNQEGESS